MRQLSNYLRRFWLEESGISSVEYALLLAFIAAGVAAAATGLGDNVAAAISGACTTLGGPGVCP